jgi:hypothetical protein
MICARARHSSPTEINRRRNKLEIRAYSQLVKNVPLIVAAALLLFTLAYLLVRWRRSPAAFKGMLIVGGTCFLSGLFAGAWILGFPNRPQPKVNVALLAQTATPLSTPVPLAQETPPPEGYYCGQVRWPVKTLSDADAAKVNLTPVPATVAELIKLPKPQVPPDMNIGDHRLPPVELTTYKIRALVVFYRSENDFDEHVVIADPHDPQQTMITELVSWTCSGAIISKERDAFRKAREDFLSLFDTDHTDSPTLTMNGKFFRLFDLLDLGWHTTDPRTGRPIPNPGRGAPPPELVKYATVEITGIGFFDDEHGAIGAAPNDIELHPLLSIRRVE